MIVKEDTRVGGEGIHGHACPASARIAIGKDLFLGCGFGIPDTVQNTDQVRTGVDWRRHWLQVEYPVKALVRIRRGRIEVLRKTKEDRLTLSG